MSSGNMLAIFYFLLEGIGNTLLVTFTCFLSAFFTGLTVAVLRRLSPLPLQKILDAMVFILRGIPILIAVFLVYFGLPSIGIYVSPLVAMNLSGSYLAEVFRGALKLVEPFEITVAKVAGMRQLQIILNIELPQMLRFSVPGIINEFSSVLKATPFAYTVGIAEITKQAMSLTAITLNGLQIYTLAGVLYFIIYKIFTLLAGVFEKKYRIS
ncbi:amino acid ABC transporter permease [Salmonella enterica subsp. enterica serovar Montevideo]|uniref:Amino acid ABC transporter permease n=2 Tax=Salmonella enterica TaxID=28901 RepID=A0A5Y4SSF9_SALER|nr:amino acid ABC transporter permease [Salmonella enterica]EAY2650280.1 amino acid ABC transporter permease [Salmonella enterica subsp. enterica serovar Dublin]EEH7297819.1 amino acid ABC transporter permease [Salmonella enterica subsp. enterica]ATT61411.1 amino acid ABC transporter ATP-binding protein [Salmonella enterica subsp. enterica serovar Montevideo str. USDA-ARS-USMARC-1900]EAA5874480.1 amino acid ABC transporter permease [Salmonella enterica]EAA6999212.1 amino acid ABC transporter p